jgi:hypothetical protein
VAEGKISVEAFCRKRLSEFYEFTSFFKNKIEYLLKWVNLVLKPYVAQNTGISHVLIYDYSSHKVSSLVKAIRSLGRLITVLPGGSTSKIQPMDVGVNKPFKDHLKKSWVLHMTSENAEKTQCENF